PLELSHNKGGIAIAITNYGKEDIRLEQITLNVYVKKGFVCKTKVDEFKSEKFKDGLPSTIPPKGDKKLNTKTNLDKLERGKIIYEVIAEFNNRKTKHVHKVKA
ncbi:MAG: hypothetical protein Q8Q56_03015, partial [Alphaproteobacteria bacterium]|nr:hypothetical protein [Alphaproteobacteria bacterium]